MQTNRHYTLQMLIYVKSLLTVNSQWAIITQYPRIKGGNQNESGKS